MNLEAIFTYTDADLSLSLEDEIQTIKDAQAGDEAAKETLLRAYGPALRSAVGGNFRLAALANPNNGSNRLDVEDLQATAVLAFLEILEAHDPEKGDRLAGVVARRLTAALVDYATSGSGFAIPERTLSRYYGILREAEGDVEVALEIAPDHHMTQETFRAVLAAVRPDSLEGETSAAEEWNAGPGQGSDGSTYRGRGLGSSSLYGETDGIADVEDQILVQAAFEAVDDEEERVCRLAYGFTSYDPVPDGEIAHKMGLTRPTVQRRRSSALGKMRKALGALEEREWKI